MSHGPGARSATALATLVVLAVCALRVAPLVDADGSFPGHDWGDIHQADAEHLTLSLADGGGLPFWSPYVQGGAALFGVPTKPFAYPPFLLAVALLGPELGMNLLTLAHVVLAGLGMVFLMRRLGTGSLGAITAALLFVLGTYPGSLFKAQPYWGYALAFWPFSLAALVGLLQSDTRRSALRCGLALGALVTVQLLAGGAFQVYWLACFSVPFCLPFLVRRGGVPLAPALLGGALAALTVGVLAAVKLLPSLHWIATSGRGGGLTHEEIFFTYSDMQPHDQGHPALTVLYVMLVVGRRLGVISLGLLALVGLVGARARTVTWGALAGLLACLVIATGPLHDLLYAWLPGYDRMRMPYRFFFPASLGAVVLAGLGADALARGWRHLTRGAGEPAGDRGRVAPRVLGAALGILLTGAVLADVELLPWLRHSAWTPSSMQARRAVAEPILAALSHGDPGRFVYPRGKDQVLWIRRRMRGVNGVLGGGGSANGAYASWLDLEAAPEDLERDARGLLDVLNVTHTASYGPLALPWLEPLASPPGRQSTTDAFAARIAADGSALEWCGFVGGTGDEEAYGVVVDDQGRTVLVGSTRSRDGSLTSRAAAPGFVTGDEDAFLARITADGRALDTCLLTGGPGQDAALDVDLGAGGRPILCGRTTGLAGSLNRTTRIERAFAGGGWDAFVAALETGSEERVAGASGGHPFVPVGPGHWRAPCAAGLLDVTADGVDLVLSGEGGQPVFWRLAFTLAEPSPDRRVVAGPPDGPRWQHLTGGGTRTPARATTSRVTIEEAWPGVDLLVTTEGGQARLIASGRAPADLERVGLVLQGAREERRDPDGTRHLDTPLGGVRLASPRLAPGGAAPPVPLTLTPDAEGITRFVPARPPPPGSWSLALTLGPRDATAGADRAPSGLHWLRATHLGGSRPDFGKSLAVDDAGDIYLAGHTISNRLLRTDLPRDPGPFRLPRGPDDDALLVKLDGRSLAPLWVTTLGGNDGDWAQGVAVDGAGRLHVIGSTRSDETSFPVRGGPQLEFGGVEDAWVARLSPAGDDIEWCGYVGGAGGDYGQGVAVTADGDVTVCGDTKSDEASLPVTGVLSPTYGGGADVFVGRIRADGLGFRWLGYLGGDDIDVPYELVLDAQDNAYIPGVTASTEATFPVLVGPDTSHNGGRWDAFACKVDPEGRLVWCGFLGGARDDTARAIAVDDQGRAHVAGGTESGERTFPVRVGPSLEAPRDGYLAYRTREVRARAKPFERPHVYARRGALPRAAVVDRPVLVVGPEPARQAALRRILGARNFDARTQVYIEDPSLDPADVAADPRWGGVLVTDPAALEAWRSSLGPEARQLSWGETGTLLKPAGRGPALLRPLGSDRVQDAFDHLAVDVRGARGDWLLLSEVLPCHPGWVARCDGNPVPLLQADGLITAVPLPEGARRVEFRYEPPGLRLGATVSTSGVVLLGLGLLALGRKRRP